MTERASNPYAAPMVEDVRSETALRAGEASAREVFLAWEKLRLYFNGILILFTLVFSGRVLFLGEYWEVLVLGAFAANIGFCLGPVLEDYLALLGAPRRGARWTIFILGTLFTMMLAAGVIGFASLKHDFGNID